MRGVKSDKKVIIKGDELCKLRDGVFLSKRRSRRNGVVMRRSKRSIRRSAVMRRSRVAVLINDDDHHREEYGIQRRVKTLKKLIPNSNRCMGLDGLFRETADYILSLQTKVKLMQTMVKVLSTTHASSDDHQDHHHLDDRSKTYIP